jgi:benzoate-CoA ligase family protein
MMYQAPEEYFNLCSFLDQNISNGHAQKTALLTPLHPLQKSYAYQDIYQKSCQLSHLLLKAGLRQEERVILSLEDGFEFICSFFAVLRAGGVVVMLNPMFKSEEIQTLLKYSRSRFAFVGKPWVNVFVDAMQKMAHFDLLALIVADQQLLATSDQPDLKSISEQISIPIFDFQESSAFDPQFNMVQTHIDDPAIWLFSGGTTGKPKAVVQPHRSFHYNSHHYGLEVLGIRSTDITLSIPKLFFGYATGCNLLFPFLVGATTIAFHAQPTPQLLIELIKNHKATVFIAVPTLINRILQSESLDVADLKSLRVCTSAGEALPHRLFEQWSQQTAVPLLDGLGTAEMWHIFISNHIGQIKVGSLGKVIKGFEVEIRDEDGKCVEVNQAGELWVKGGARAIGYWQQQSKSEYAFQGEWYRSGDLISRDEEGFIYYCGRKDDMVKVAGRWVAPKDVEDCFSQCEWVQEVAVIACQNQAGLTKTKAFIQLKQDVDHQLQMEQKLMDFAKAKLSSYQIPSEIIVIQEFPKTHLGKIDRGALKRIN